MKVVTIREHSSLYSTEPALTIESVIGEVQETNEPLILVRDDKPVVAVIPFSDYERFTRWRETEMPPREAADNGFEREHAAFQRLKPDLLKTHYGLYVAIHNEQLADADSSDSELAKRIYAKHLFPVDIELVSNELQSFENPSPEEVWDVSL
ncbi:MAG: hypothetical protein HY741_21810 [Chloroflexi bacterium]|nr:hypothetical protein [Chloroflexota bacterium]